MERYELIWAAVAVSISALIIAALGIASVALQVNPPSHIHAIDPEKLPAEFIKPGLRRVGPLEYEVFVVARQFFFNPPVIKVPSGSRLTFYLTSLDVVHGFLIVGTNVNTMIIPGQVQVVSFKADKPGEYLIICTEFCGRAHHGMMATLIVE